MQEDLLLSANPNLELEQDGPPVGTIVDGRYKLLEVAGRGGMGVVYKAEHLHISNVIALKMLLKEANADEHAYKRFLQEAKAASQLKHPNIITIHDFGLHDKKLAYLAMDFVDGRSLYEVIHLQPLSLERFKHIFFQACDALAHAHKHGMVHRDIKPSNLLLVQRDEDRDFLVIVDFGLVKRTDGEDQKLTSADMLVGSPLYMSPEQCRGLEIDQRTDIYSLGCVMYEALTGIPPLAGDSPLDTLYKHVAVQPPPFKEVNPSACVPPALEAAVMKALSKDAKKRQQTMQELKADIDRALTGSIMSPHPLVLDKTQISQASGSKVPATIKSKPPAPPSGQFRTRKKSTLWLWLGPLLAATLVFGLIIAALVQQLVKVEHSSVQSPTPPAAVANTEPAETPPARDNNAPPQPAAKHPPGRAQTLKEIAALQKQAHTAFTQGDYQSARDKYLKCLALQQSVFGTDAKQEVGTIAYLILCQDKLGDEDATVEYLNKLSDLFGAYPAEIASNMNLLITLADISEAHGDKKLAIALLKNAINTHDHNCLVADVDSFKLRLRLSDLLISESNLDEAKSLLKWIYNNAVDFPRIREAARLKLIAVLEQQNLFIEAEEYKPHKQPYNLRQPGWNFQPGNFMRRRKNNGY